MNGDMNEVPAMRVSTEDGWSWQRLSLRGFPAIWAFSAKYVSDYLEIIDGCSNGIPIEYVGERTVQGLVNFVGGIFSG